MAEEASGRPEPEPEPAKRLKMGKRDRSSLGYKYQLSIDDHSYLKKLRAKWRKFSSLKANQDLDDDIKSAALNVSSSVVSLVSYSGKKGLSVTSGTIIEADGDNYTVLTTAGLVRHVKEDTVAANVKVVVHAPNEGSYRGKIIAYDFHYNLLVVVFRSKSSFQCANLKFVDLHQDIIEEETSGLRCHQDFVKVEHGDRVIIVGRYFYKPFSFMAAPGFIGQKCFQSYDCKELLSVDCRMTRCGDGGPLINLSGEMIGMVFYDFGFATPFLPINICCKWWNHYKKYKEQRHLSYGLEVSSLYMADLSILDMVKRKFPNITGGILVNKVLPLSSVLLREGDVIVKCDQKIVRSFLELWDIMWDKVGQSVELEVAQVDLGKVSSVSMVVAEAKPNALNKWPRLPSGENRDVERHPMKWERWTYW